MRNKCCSPTYMKHPIMTAGVVFLAGVGMCGIVMSIKSKKKAMGDAVKKYTSDCVQKCESICSSMCQSICDKLEGMGNSASSTASDSASQN